MKTMLASVVLLLAALPLSAAERPNILWLTSEDHGPHMGCYGDKVARTPNVDALAAKGMRFAKVWSVAPVCAPARSAIISGIYPSSSGGLHMRSMVPLPAEFKLFPAYLRGAGYFCTNNSKEDYNVRKPAGTWDVSSQKAHWKQRRDGQPFFAVFNSTKSHESQFRKERRRAVTDPATVRVPAYHPDTPEVREDWARYYDTVTEADADAGDRLRELDEAGLAGDTIVFYFADHGSGLPRNKRWPGNSGLHVPMVVYFPEKWKHLAPKEYEAGGTSDRLVSFVDLAPTVLSLAGIAAPPWMQGHAFAGTFQSEPQPFLFGERGRMDESLDLIRSATDGRYVYIRNYYPHRSHGQHNDYQFVTSTTQVWKRLYDEGRTNAAQSRFWTVPKEPVELYDLESDPDEVKNLARSPEHRDVLLKLWQAQVNHAAAIRDVALLPEGDFLKRSEGSTPYEVGHDDARYPFARIFAAADLASNLDPDAVPRLVELTKDPDGGVRYWGTQGLLMRGRAGVAGNEPLLRDRLKSDRSPYVRIAAAEALAMFGSPDDLEPALAVLKDYAAPQNHGVFASIAALTTIEELGAKGDGLRDFVRGIDPNAPVPDKRYDDYVPRLVRSIGGR